MSALRRLSLALKAARQLGLRPLGLLAAYRLKLYSGWLRYQTPLSPPPPPAGLSLRPVLAFPSPEELRHILGGRVAGLLAEADEIVAGQVRLFGGRPVPLELAVPAGEKHWSAYEHGAAAKAYGDIKFVWEPARFGWACTLGRAFHISGDERYPRAFWGYAERFWEANPPNRGPNWASAQEVALRLVAFTFAAQAFAPSEHSTPLRLERLARSVAEHAARIPPTLGYARAQNNNHLLSEAVGLITAGLALPAHPAAARWLKLGHRWLNAGLEAQIAADGTYSQHSTNYHRLMLQLALWANACLPPTLGLPLRLGAATRWLLELLDPLSGQVPNLGHNDGAYILPFTVCPFEDYRPVLQAASRAFLGQAALPAGAWDEMSLWVGAQGGEKKTSPSGQPGGQLSPHARLAGAHSWGYLRAVRYSTRPGQADALHLDLWWQGLNVAQDAGTYRYTAGAPWENALASAAVHNTLCLEGQEPMTRAGKFLWLDWVQSRVIARQADPQGNWEKIVAEHDGYRRYGLIQRRTVTAFRPDRWRVEDTLSCTPQAASEAAGAPPGSRAVLHWLLPDWEWQIIPGPAGTSLELRSPHGPVQLHITHPPEARVSLVRAGQMLFGEGSPSPVRGWTSPTYGARIAALSLAITTPASLPLVLASEWAFPVLSPASAARPFQAPPAG